MSEETPPAVDSNGAPLANGDSVTITKDLKIKGMSAGWKRGQKVKSIRLTDNPEEVECRVGKATVVIKTCFVKKA